MRLCLLAHRYYESNSHMMQFARAFRSREDDVDVIAVRRGNLPRHEVIDGVNLYRIHDRTNIERSPIAHSLQLGAFMLRAAAVIGWKHWKNPYDVIHVQSIPDFLVFSALIPKLMGCKVILDLRDLVPELYASKFLKREDSLPVRALKRVESLSVRVADHVIVANPIWNERIIHRHSIANKCSVFWYYPDTAIFHPRIRTRQDGKFQLLYPGSLHRHQGVDIAIRAMSRIVREIPEAELHILGNGPAKSDLYTLTQKLNLGTKVFFEEIVPIEEIPNRMAQCDIGLVPKKASDVFGNEAASSKILEFMAVGVPIVASRTKIETCLYGDALLRYFQSENEDSLANAVISIYRDAALRDTLIRNGLKYIEQNNWATRISEYTSLVQGIIK